MISRDYLSWDFGSKSRIDGVIDIINGFTQIFL